MRAKRTHQMSIYETFAEHEIGQELKAISGWLDQHVEVLDWAEKDIQRTWIKDIRLSPGHARGGKLDIA